MYYIAVYGSLKEGAYNHRAFGLGKPITKTKVKGSMYLQGSFPRLFKEEDSHPEHIMEYECEIYEVSAQIFVAIDRMEVGAGYISDDFTLVGEDGNDYYCTLYYSEPHVGSRTHYLQEYSEKTVPNAYIICW
jgi:gamma-glutamylcyclotransferase (GGCT)/AIG2-like uncharacterized protein YtfP